VARKYAITKRLMGQILHSCACTTAAVRRAIQHSQESLLKLSERYGINPKTVWKWRKRSFVEDAPMGPKERRSTILTREQEAVVVAFRKPSCRSTTVSTLFKPAFLTSLVRPSIVASSAMGLVGCRIWTPQARIVKSSKPIPSVTFTSTSQRSAPRRETLSFRRRGPHFQVHLCPAG